MTGSEFGIRSARWPEDRQALALVRRLVFIEEQGVPANLEWDGADPTAWHWLALGPAGRAIGAARLLPSGQIGRMAVLPAWRGRGVGRALLGAVLAHIDLTGGPAPFLHAQVAALGFYERQGFVPEGPTFMDAGIPHRRMRR